MFKRQNIHIFEYAKILLFSMIVFGSTGIATASANQSPVPVDPGDQTAIVGEYFTLQLIANDSEGDRMTFAVGGLPDDISFNQSTGVVSGVSNAGTEGTYEILYQVWDTNSQIPEEINELTFTLQVNANQPPIPVNPGDQTTMEGQYFTLQIIATDPEGGNINYSAGPFPDGISFDEFTGLISGVSLKGTAGLYEIHVEVFDDTEGQPDVNEMNFILQVNEYLGDNRAPLVTNPGTQYAKEGDLVNLPIIATDPDGDNLSYAATNLPDGLTIDSTTGVISGFIAFDTVRGYIIQVAATDDGTPLQSAAVEFNMNIGEAGINQPPSIFQIEKQSATEGDIVNLTISATDPDGDNLSFTANGLPDGLTIDSTTGVISGTVATGTAGIYAITIFVLDDGTPDFKQAKMVFAMQIHAAVPNQPPSVDTPDNKSVTEGDAVALAIIATDPDGDNLSYAATNLPSGLTIDSTTGVISGTIGFGTAGLTYRIVIVVTDDGDPNKKGTSNFQVKVNAIEPNQPPSIFQIEKQSATEGDIVNLPISATDPDGDNLSFTANGLPDGLTIDSTSGVISGTIASGTAGIYAITIFVLDDGTPDYKQAKMVFTARIHAAVPNQPPSVDNPGNQSASKGDAVTLAIIATDPDGDNLRYAANNLPNGLSINSATGLISGTVNNSAMATNNVQVIVSDDATNAESSSISFTWNISDADAIPSTNPTNVPTLSEWSMILLTLLLMGFGMVSTRTEPRKHK